MSKQVEFIPCQYFGTDYGDYGTHYDYCEADEVGTECSAICPSYKPVPVGLCRKHKKQYIESCEDCDAEYWEKLGRREEFSHRIEARLRYCHLLIKVSRFDEFGGWVLNYRPQFRQEWKTDSKGRVYYGLHLTGLRRCFRIGFYTRIEED